MTKELWPKPHTTGTIRQTIGQIVQITWTTVQITGATHRIIGITQLITLAQLTGYLIIEAIESDTRSKHHRG